MTTKTFGKDAWVEMLREIGLDDATMHRWHAVFEERWPDSHQEFLEWLGIEEAEIQQIREHVRKG